MLERQGLKSNLDEIVAYSCNRLVLYDRGMAKHAVMPDIGCVAVSVLIRTPLAANNQIPIVRLALEAETAPAGDVQFPQIGVACPDVFHLEVLQLALHVELVRLQFQQQLIAAGTTSSVRSHRTILQERCRRFQKRDQPGLRPTKVEIRRIHENPFDRSCASARGTPNGSPPAGCASFSPRCLRFVSTSPPAQRAGQVQH
jgi:hypothetical protein